MTEEKRRIEVNWVQSIAGALAAVTSAVLLSTVGVAGTLIGAALGSVAVTLGSAVYSYYIGATKDRVETVALAASRLGQAHARVRAASRDVAEGDPGAQEELSRADAELQRARVLVDQEKEEPARPGWRAVLAGLPWKRITLVAAGIFAAAMVIILAFELATGRSLSSYTGGSDSHQRVSIPGLGGGGGDQSPAPDQGTPATTPGDGTGTSTVPSGSPSPTATTNQTAVPPLTEGPSSSASPTPTPTSAPSSSPTPSSNASGTPTP